MLNTEAVVPRLNRRFLRRLCRNGENSRSRESHSGNALESGRWGLAKCLLVSLAEALQLSETEAVGNFCDVCVVRIGVAQPAARSVWSLTATSAHNSCLCKGRLRCSAKTSSNLTMMLA